MNAMLNITIRMNAREALAQTAALRTAINQVGTGVGGAAGAASGLGALNTQLGSMSNLEKFGKNLQWTGRQLEFNFTLPLVLAGGAATKFALDNEAAFTQVQKAYRAFTGDTADTKAELDALRTTFELLSDIFGIHQDQVIKIAANWAQAGAAGVGLAKATRLTMETMILAQEDATTATTQLLTIQGAYRLNSDQLRGSLVSLNAVQVTTAIEFGGLVDAVSRAAGAAASAGIDLDHLAAMAAALVPATGSAAAAGNALRTIISRLMSPTKQAAEEMELMGINVLDASWQAMNGVQRIEAMSAAFENLSDGQKTLVSSVIASRWQINRFDILMRDIADSTGVYHTALLNTADTTKANALYAQQLATVLSSTPQGFKILTTNIQNAMAKAIVPLLPVLTQMLGLVLKLVSGFTSLSPEVQELALGFLLVLALIGPITRYMGSFTLLFTTVGKAAAWFYTQLFGVAVAEAELATEAEVANVAMVRQGGVLNWLFQGFKFLVTAPLKAAAAIWTWVGNWITGNGAITAAFEESVALDQAAMASEISILEGMAAAQAAAAAQFAEAAAIRASEEEFVAEVAAASAAATVAAKAEEANLYIEAEMAKVAAAQAAAESEAMAARVMAAVDEVIAKYRFAIWESYYNAVTIMAEESTLAIAESSSGLAFFQVDAAGVATAANTAAASTEVAVWTMAYTDVAAASTVFYATETMKRNVWLAMENAIGSQAAISGANRFALRQAGAIETSAVEISSAEAAAAGVAAASAAEIAAMEGVTAAALGADAALAAPVVAAGGAAAGISAATVGIVAAIAAVVVAAGLLVWKFHDAIWGALQSIFYGIMKLPEVFARALQGVINVIGRGASVIIDALSHLNPFARHSPSLVDNVQLGLSTVLDEYKTLQKIPGIIQVATEAQREFDLAVQAGADGLQMENYLESKGKIVSVIPDAGPAIDNMIASILQMKDALKAVNVEYQAQQQLVDAMQSQIDTEMKPYNDAIKANELAQKRLRLEILKMKEAGKTVEDMKNKMAALAGEIEMLRGIREDLRLAGAGSDILGVYDKQINALQAQQVALEGQVDPIQKLQDELAALQTQAEMLNLEKDIRFDPQLDELDAQKNKLAELKQAYEDINSEITQMENKLSQMASAATQAKQAASTDAPSLNAAQFDAASGANFPDVTGDTIPGLGAEGGLPDIEAFNADLQKELDNALANMGSLDMFEPIKAKFREAWEWIKDNGPTIVLGALAFLPMLLFKFRDVIWGAMQAVGGAIFDVLSWVFDRLRSIWDTLASVFMTVWNSVIYPVLSAVYDFLMSFLVPIWNALATAVDWVWNQVIVPAVQMAWAIIQPIFQFIYDFIVGYLIPIFELIAVVWALPFMILGAAVMFCWQNVLEPAFDWIWNNLETVLVPAFQYFGTIVDFVFTAIGAIIQFVWDSFIAPIFNQITWILNTVVGPAFMWLWTNFVQPSISLIGQEVQWVWDNVLSPIFGGISWFIDNVAGPAFWRLHAVVTAVWNGIAGIISWVWGGIQASIENGINWMINAFNFLAEGVNNISDFLGFGRPVSLMSQIGGGGGGGDAGQRGRGFEAGTAMLSTSINGPGFITNIPTAIVGEGNSSYNEFVIPTDPKYRDRALGLYAQLGTQLLAGGGVFGDPVGALQDGADMVKSFWHNIEDALGAIGHIEDLPVIGQAAEWMKNTVVDWGEEQIRRIPGLGVILDAAGHLVSGFETVIGGIGDVGSTAWDNTFGHLLQSGGTIPQMAAGGIVAPRPGGTLVNVAEKNQGEAIIYPLSDGGVKKEYHFHGDLSFPNITSGADAGVFIQNLESLVGN